jgi:type I restriction enzyme S subunit
MVNEGDIILCKTASVGKVARVKQLPEKATINPQLVLIKNIKTNPQYLFYILDDTPFQVKIKGLAGVGSVPNVSQAKLSSIQIPIPSLEEQNRIVGILDTFTASIDNLKEQIAQRRKQYEYYRCRLFSKDKWEEIKIGELTKVFSCPRVFKDQWQVSGVPFWRSSDIMSYHNGVINPRGEVFISQSLYDELSSKSDKIKEGDILVTGGGSIGIPYLKMDNSPLFVKDADLICIQKCSSIVPKYLYHYFLSTDFKLYLKKITHDATIAHYTINQIKDTPIPLPPLSEQQRIVNILDQFEASIQNLEAQLSQREKQYEYYRNKLLTFED